MQMEFADSGWDTRKPDVFFSEFCMLCSCISMIMKTYIMRAHTLWIDYGAWGLIASKHEHLNRLRTSATTWKTQSPHSLIIYGIYAYIIIYYIYISTYTFNIHCITLPLVQNAIHQLGTWEHRPRGSKVTPQCNITDALFVLWSWHIGSRGTPAIACKNEGWRGI